MKTARLYVDVHYHERRTDAESLAAALDILLETALSTPGILDEYGNPTIDKFFVLDGELQRQPSATGSAALAFILPREGEGTFALVKARRSPELQCPNTVMQALMRAVTSWVQETSAGRALWAESSQDLNIGDLYAHGITPALRARLALEGVFDLDIEVHEPGKPCAYVFDSVLVADVEGGQQAVGKDPIGGPS